MRDVDLLERAFEEARTRVDNGTLTAAQQDYVRSVWQRQFGLITVGDPRLKARASATVHMRIIAGTNKGRTLKAPKWDGLRPTSDKLRETLFNILAPRVARRTRAGRVRGHRRRWPSKRSAAALPPRPASRAIAARRS